MMDRSILYRHLFAGQADLIEAGRDVEDATMSSRQDGNELRFPSPIPQHLSYFVFHAVGDLDTKPSVIREGKCTGYPNVVHLAEFVSKPLCQLLSFAE